MNRLSFRNLPSAASLVVCLALGACSPYVYKDEVASFGKGVDTSVQAFQALMPQYTEWADEQRDKTLLSGFEKTKVKPSVSDGCGQLRQEYLSRFSKRGATADDLLTAKDYGACQTTPVSSIDPDKGLPNLSALGAGLQAYAAGLAAITSAQDEADLQSAYGQLNTSANALLAAVNEKLAEKDEAALDAVGALVYQVGLDYLRERRFEALKQAVNDNTPVVDRAADLLAEGAFDIYGPTLSARQDALDTAEDKAVQVTDSNFVLVWNDINQSRKAYIKAFQGSPIYAFARIKSTHAALRASINDPTNKAQLEALYDNAVALEKAAKAALEAAQGEQGG